MRVSVAVRSRPSSPPGQTKKAIDQILCVKCGECVVGCPPEYDAIKRVSPPELAPVIERDMEV